MYVINAIEVFGLSRAALNLNFEDYAVGYRRYLQRNLEKRYPSAKIVLNATADADSPCSVSIDGEPVMLPGGEAEHNLDVRQFLEQCWRDCHWSWVA